MKTKEDELKILTKIEKLIQEAGGDDSYIGAAFAGACDDARENIKWDMACSYMDRYECKVAEAEKMERVLGDLVDEKDAEILKLQNELKSTRERLDVTRENLHIAQDNAKRLTGERDSALGELSEAKAGEEWEKVRADQAELQLLKLKAKLYDKMIEEGE
jgi:hypothetical protein